MFLWGQSLCCPHVLSCNKSGIWSKLHRIFSANLDRSKLGKHCVMFYGHLEICLLCFWRITHIVMLCAYTDSGPSKEKTALVSDHCLYIFIVKSFLTFNWSYWIQNAWLSGLVIIFLLAWVAGAKIFSIVVLILLNNIGGYSTYWVCAGSHSNHNLILQCISLEGGTNQRQPMCCQEQILSDQFDWLSLIFTCTVQWGRSMTTILACRSSMGTWTQTSVQK